MADFLGYSVTRLANAQITTPRWQVQGRIVDSQTQQTVLQDITAAGIIFPNVLGNLTATQQDQWVEKVMADLILRRFGLDV